MIQKHIKRRFGVLLCGIFSTFPLFHCVCPKLKWTNLLCEVDQVMSKQSTVGLLDIAKLR